MNQISPEDLYGSNEARPEGVSRTTLIVATLGVVLVVVGLATGTLAALLLSAAAFFGAAFVLSIAAHTVYRFFYPTPLAELRGWVETEP